VAQQDFSREEAAEYLRTTYGFRCKEGLLRKLACIGGGPKFYRIGGKSGRFVRYARDDLDAWAAERITPRVGKASELKAQQCKAA
jgi:hypothetical protein